MTAGEAVAALRKVSRLWPEWMKDVTFMAGEVVVMTPLGPVRLSTESGGGMRSKRVRLSSSMTRSEMLREVEKVAGKAYRSREKQANKPRTPLETKTSLERKTPVKAVNWRRRRKKHQRNFGDDYGDIVRSMPCILCGREPYGEVPIVAAHLTRRRGMGGANADKTYTGPLCTLCHAWEEGRTPEEVEEATGVDLYAELEAVREHVQSVLERQRAKG